MGRHGLLVVTAACIFIGSGLVAAEPKKGTFDARHELKVVVPEGAKKVRVWFALPQDVPQQKVSELKIEGPSGHKVEKDSEGNAALYVEINDPKEKEFVVLATFRVERSEVQAALDPAKAQPLSDQEKKDLAKYLAANKHVVIDDQIRKLATQIVGGETNALKAARKIYDWVLQNIEYWVKDPANKKASPVGSSEYCLTSKTGNCTDFHSLWTALARAQGIPTRMVYGSFFKAELNGKDADQSYHCWPEFYVSGLGWIAHDVAVADIFAGEFPLNDANTKLVNLTTASGYSKPDPAMVEYYFGNLDERRVTWSVGRDLTLSPKQDGDPVNALAKAYIEVDGKVHPEKTGWTRKLTYNEVK